MRRTAFLVAAGFLISISAARSRAQTVEVGDAWVTGQTAVGTTTYSARFGVTGSSSAATAFQVSGVDGTPFLTVASSGAAGAGVNPLAGLDVSGSGDSGAAALELRDGNLSPLTSGYQMTFGFNGSSGLRHALRTEHSTAATGGSVDFLLWTPSLSTTAVGALEVLSIVTTSTGASVHVLPVGTPAYPMVISNGAATGGGTLHRLSEGSVSSRALKSDIRYLGPEDELRAYEDVKGLRHAEFRYKSWKKGKLARDKKQPMRRGLIYEDAPASIQSSAGRGLIVDERVVNLEMALKELMRRIEGARAEADAMADGAKP